MIKSASPDPHFGVVPDPSRIAVVLICLSLWGCVYVPSVMWNRAEANRARIDRVQVGQSLDEVRTLMGKPPEKREVRARFDGKTVELWSYATDFTRKVDTTIIFLDGRVTEIRATSWEERD